MARSHVSIVIALVAALASSTSAFADQERWTLEKSEEYRNADHDPEGIWPDKDLAPFGGEHAVRRARAATITEFRAATPAGTFVLSQLLSADCSAQLCPARLVKVGANGEKTILVDDMMHIGGPFILDLKSNQLLNQDYTFTLGQ